MGEYQLHRKVIGVPLQKGISKSTDGFALVRGKFTSDQRDEVGDIITRSATEKATSRFRQWGNIRYMHQDRPVGRVVRMGLADGLEWNEVEIKVIDPQAAFEVENGLLQALSIGALVNMQDVELQADGGWVINDYSLAEISLVDHPANYDARLMLSLDLDEAVRSLAREEGLYPILRSLGIHVKETKQMSDAADEIKQAIEEAAAVPDVAEAAASEAATSEAAVAEEPAVETSQDEVQEPAAGEQPVEEPVAEAPEAEKSVSQSVSQDVVAKAMDDNQVEEIRSMIKGMQGLMTDMQNCMSQMMDQMKSMKSLAPVEGAPEVEVVKALAEEEKPVDAVPDQEDLRKKIADLEAQVAELSKPVDRKGMLPAEELPAPETEKPEETVAEIKAMDLRSAIKRFVETRH